MKKQLAYILMATLFSFCISCVFSQGVAESKIVYAQPFKFKALIGEYASVIIEDSLIKKKMLVIRSEKKATFSLLDANWKLLNSFEATLDKKSAYTGLYPTVASYSVQGDVWTTIVEGNESFAVEKIDFGTKSYQFAGKIFEDRDKDYTNRSFQVNRNTCNLYMTKKGDINMAVIDVAGKINSYSLDLSTQITQGKKEFKPKVVFDNLDIMGPGLVAIPEYTYKKFHFYTEYESLVISAVYEKPLAELMYYDWNTGKKVRSDVFSVEDLLPAGEKNSNTNSTVLVYDNKVWVMAAYKNGGVLGVFDRVSKKLLYHFLYNDQSAKEIFSYGPVFYKAVPGTITGYKEKLEDVSADFFCKEVFKRNTALTIHELNSNEYVVSLGSYDEISVSTDKFKRTGPSLMGGFPEKLAAGLVFQKNDFKNIPKKTSFNELNNVNLSDNYEKAKKTPVKTSDPEFSQKGALYLQTQYSYKRSLTMYLYDGQFKILESIYE